MMKQVIYLGLLFLFVSFAAADTSYIYGGSLLASRSGEDIRHFHQDSIGSNRIITDEDGLVVAKSVSYPFGMTFEDGSFHNEGTDYKFTGKEKDGSLYYYGARYYKPGTISFLSLDSAGEMPYGYVMNNPLRYVDPSGNWVESVPDAISLCLSTRDMINEPSLVNAGWVGIDLAGLLIPGMVAPGIFRHGDEIIDATKLVRKFPGKIKSLWKQGEPIGEGMIGEVTRVGDDVIKRARPGVVSDMESEMDALIELSKEGIAPATFEQIVKDEGEYFLIREFVEGSHLKIGELSLEEAKRIARKAGIIEGKTGTIITDLYNQNIVRTPQGRLKVIDGFSWPNDAWNPRKIDSIKDLRSNLFNNLGEVVGSDDIEVLRQLQNSYMEGLYLLE